MKLAIQPDLVRRSGSMPGPQSFSARWVELADERGIEVDLIDVFRPGVMERIRQCDGFMWRVAARHGAVAKRLLPAIEVGLRLPVYPSWNTWRHHRDKIYQHYLLEGADLPCPQTRVFWREEEALEFCRTAAYPFVTKLSNGRGSDSVALLRRGEDAEKLVHRLFGEGVDSLDRQKLSFRERFGRRALLNRIRGGATNDDREHGYFLVQEFLPYNGFDTRVTVIGNRAFCYRRFNREGDFRASGSGKFDWDQAPIDPAAIRLGFEVARRLGTQSIAIDVLTRGEEKLIIEINFAFLQWPVLECPGQWELHGEDLRWIEGRMRPEDAIFDDFVSAIQSNN